MATTELPRRAENTVNQALQEFPVVAIVGPRQSGKSTLARRVLRNFPKAIHLDLELPSHLHRLMDAEAYLSLHTDRLVCLDEVQRCPNLFPVLRALVDQDRRPGRYLILGSASPDFLQQSTESLAGRIAYIDLTPFTIDELPDDTHTEQHWLRGGYPDSYLAGDDAASFRWREQFIRTFLDRDIPALGINLTRGALERLWTMLASTNGNLLNNTKLADPVGASPQALRRYIDILEATFMVRLLRPWYTNTKKRLVRSPKVYIRDTGLLHALLGIRSWDHLYGHLAVGRSWEAYVVEQIIVSCPDWRSSFYRATGGAELDLILERSDRTIAIEIKSARAPRVTRGFYNACADVSADERYVVAPLGSSDLYPIGRDTTLCTPDRLISRLA